jgi:predicted acyltransferase
MDQNRANPSGRLISLDVFRGATIAAMILVNNPGNWGHIYGPLDHADWNGWTMADLIFPFFLFIVGITTTISLSNARAKTSERGIFVKILKRAAIIFALGLFLNGFPDYDFSTIRIMGVLQRIAVCYFFAAIICLKLKPRWQAVIAVALLFAYWALMAFYPVPGVGAGVWEKGKNFAAYIDQMVLNGHIWSASKTWDPEGIVSTLPALSTTLFGVLTGYWLLGEATKEKKALGLAAIGAIGLTVGSLWGLVLPINKSLWTSSYSVFMAGFALVALAACYYAIEIKQSRWWTQPFIVFGSNAITAFVASGLIARIMILWTMPFSGPKAPLIKSFLYRTYFASWLSPINASLAFSVAFLAVLYLPLWVLYRRRIFIKV